MTPSTAPDRRPRRHPSLTLRMSLTLVVITLVVGSAAAVWSYRNALESARALQDGVLVQVASIAATSRGASTDAGPGAPAGTGAATDIDIVPLPNAGVPSTTPDGLSERTVGGQDVRVVVARRGDGTRVLVSQPIAARDHIARQAAASAVLPFAVLLPLLLAALAVAIRLFLRPVNHLATHVRGRDVDDLTPVDDSAAPRELVGFLDALNGQVARVRAATDHEGLFLSQAAHELRTPLTAMSLQLERAARAADLPSARHRLVELHSGLRRTRHVVEQLLQLAAARSRPERGVVAPFDTALDDVVRDVVDELLPIADAHSVDIEVRSAATSGTLVPGPTAAAVLRNLVDNAIKYGAQPGLVVVTVGPTPGGIAIHVDDAGPGFVDAATAVQAFQREERYGGAAAWGSGLGLAIVTELLDGIGGTLTFVPSRVFDAGTRASVVLRSPPAHVRGDDSGSRKTLKPS